MILEGLLFLHPCLMLTLRPGSQRREGRLSSIQGCPGGGRLSRPCTAPRAPVHADHHLPACKSRGGPADPMGHTSLGNGGREPAVPTDLLFPQTCDGHSERTKDAQRMAPAHLPLPSSGRALGMKTAPFPHLTPGLVQVSNLRV